MQTFIFETGGADGSGMTWACDLSDFEVAKAQAIETLGEMMTHGAADFWRRPDVQMTVSTVEGLVLFRIDLAAALSPALAYRPSLKEPLAARQQLEDGVSAGEEKSQQVHSRTMRPCARCGHHNEC